MKRIIIMWATLLLILIGSSSALAQDDATPKHSKLSLGYTLYNCHQSFGHGLTLTTPYFLNDRIAVRLSVNQALLEGIPEGKTEYELMTYTAYKLGLVGVAGMINESIRLYGEGGFIYIIPNSRLSENNVLGGYGHFGFEFFMNSNSPVCYFIELGSIGTGARAEKLSGKPLYLNGFATAVGLRFHF